MAKQGDYINYLVLNASRGHRNAFLELVGFVHKEIFQIAYLLLADKQKALETTIEIFTFTYKNLSALPDEMTYQEWIKSLVIVNSFNKIKLGKGEKDNNGESNLKAKFKEEELDKFSSLEKSFPQIDDISRIVLILYLKLNYEIESIANLMPKKSIEDIRFLICDTLNQLYNLSNPDHVFQYERDKIYEYLFSNKDISVKEQDPDMGEQQVFFKMIADIKNLYTNVDVSSEIIKGVTEFLMQAIDPKPAEKAKRKAQTDKLIKSTDVSKVLGNTFKNLEEKEKTKTDKIQLLLSILKFSSVLLLLAVIVVYFLFFHTPSVSWDVKTNFGAYTINSEQGIREISQDDVFHTKRFSSVVIGIPGIAEIAVDEETEFVLLDDSKVTPKINLKSGSLRYESKTKPNTKLDPEYNLTIITEFGNIIAEHGSAFNINISEKAVEGISGVATIELSNDVRIFIGSGYKFIYTSLYDLPMRDDLTEELKSLVKNSQTFKANADFIIPNLRENDIFTLLSAFVYLDQEQKRTALNKIKEFVPFIDNNIENKILQNDKAAYEFLVESVKALSDSFMIE
ncbi:MAG: hypothetical protein PHW27_04710 [Melioribacteraceae bacterium]|nr:hypothetical protein [Melioribacteraceae bacterium]